MLKELIIDKGSDIIVVTLGVLLALSVGSCREKIKDKSEWRAFSKHTKSLAKSENQFYEKHLIQLDTSMTKGKSLLEDIYKKKAKKSEVLQYLDSFGSLPISYPSSNHYEAFLKTNNPLLTKDYDYFVLLDEFFNYSEIAKSFLDVYLNQVIPDLRKSIKKNRMWDPSFDVNKNFDMAEEVSFMIRSYMSLTSNYKNKLLKQNKRAKEIIDYKGT